MNVPEKFKVLAKFLNINSDEIDRLDHEIFCYKKDFYLVVDNTPKYPFTHYGKHFSVFENALIILLPKYE